MLATDSGPRPSRGFRERHGTQELRPGHHRFRPGGREGGDPGGLLRQDRGLDREGTLARRSFREYRNACPPRPSGRPPFSSPDSSNRALYGLQFTLKQQVNVRDFMARERYICDTERARIQANLKRHRVRVYSGMASFVPTPTPIAIKPTREPRRSSIRGERDPRRDRLVPLPAADLPIPRPPSPRLRHHPDPPRHAGQHAGLRWRRDRLRIRLHVRRPRGEGHA